MHKILISILQDIYASSGYILRVHVQLFLNLLSIFDVILFL